MSTAKAELKALTGVGSSALFGCSAGTRDRGTIDLKKHFLGGGLLSKLISLRFDCVFSPVFASILSVYCLKERLPLLRWVDVSCDFCSIPYRVTSNRL